MPTEDAIAPGEKWAFDAEVARDFDGYLSRSIPDAGPMRRIVTALALRFATQGSAIFDLGCARGEALAPLIEARGDWHRYLGVEASEPMAAAARERFATLVAEGTVRIEHANLKGWFPAGEASVILSVLTLQFVPIEHRQAVLRRCWQALVPGGAMILVEKVLGSSAAIDAALVGLYYDVKRSAGFSDVEIQRKRLSLEGVLVPVTARMNEDFLAGAGFSQVDCIWRSLNFAGWLAVK